MKNQGGMVAKEEMLHEDRQEAERIWLDLVNYTKKAVGKLNDLKVHKQWANRPLEWFGYIDVLVSSTDWANFFELRDEVGAQPEIDDLAKAMKVAMDASTPWKLNTGDWHLPYIEDNDLGTVSSYLVSTNSQLSFKETLQRISVARCARLTIKPFDGDGSIEKELKRYDLLMVSRPVHASPAEHIATPDEPLYGFSVDDPSIAGWMNQHEHGNFYGWRQFRKMIPHNTINDR